MKPERSQVEPRAKPGIRPSGYRGKFYAPLRQPNEYMCKYLFTYNNSEMSIRKNGRGLFPARADFFRSACL